MLQIKSKRELAQDAEILAVGNEYIWYNNVIYAPVHMDTKDDSVIPPINEKIWVPLLKQDLMAKARYQFNTMFETEQQLDSFYYMVAQSSTVPPTPRPSLLIRTGSGLRELKSDGRLYEPTGEFIPNTLKPTLNEDPVIKDRLMTIISEWVGGEEEALSLMKHFATALAPHWSAVKYVLLIGNGRNGKSLLMHMLMGIFGQENCSGVTRQDIADKSPAILDLNGKLLNLVFDGMAQYLKDSGMEKSLIAGEEVRVRRLYSSSLTAVQTNALFVEGLNREPRSSDKSTALQARIIRFWFPNTYEADRHFWNTLVSEEYVGALLSILIDNYVKETDVSIMLAPTENALQLQFEHMYENSYALQFIEHILNTEVLGVSILLDMEFPELVRRFQVWRLMANDLNSWSEPEVLAIFRPVLLTERKSKRVAGTPRKIRVITGFTKETLMFIDTMKGEEDVATTVVDD